MKVNYKLNSDGYIVEYVVHPFDPYKPWIEISNPQKIHLYWDTVKDGRLVCNHQYGEVERYLKRIQTLQAEIIKYKQKLNETDYLALKHFEGEISDEDFAATKKERANWRKQINSLQKDLQNVKSNLASIRK